MPSRSSNTQHTHTQYTHAHAHTHPHAPTPTRTHKERGGKQAGASVNRSHLVGQHKVHIRAASIVEHAEHAPVVAARARNVHMPRGGGLSSSTSGGGAGGANHNSDGDCNAAAAALASATSLATNNNINSKIIGSNISISNANDNRRHTTQNIPQLQFSSQSEWIGGEARTRRGRGERANERSVNSGAQARPHNKRHRCGRAETSSGNGEAAATAAAASNEDTLSH